MVGTIALFVIGSPAFKCKIDVNPRRATSADANVTVVAEFEGRILIYKKGSKSASHLARWSEFGHHPMLVVSRDGSAFAIYDEYAGMEVFDGMGKKIAFLDPKKVLSKSELQYIPGKWACHNEGTWLENPTLRFDKDKLTFAIYNGRKIQVPLKG
jgi:hypothetical protein